MTHELFLSARRKLLLTAAASFGLMAALPLRAHTRPASPALQALLLEDHEVDSALLKANP